jgi:hypothetical protein
MWSQLNGAVGGVTRNIAIKGHMLSRFMCRLIAGTPIEATPQGSIWMDLPKEETQIGRITDRTRIALAPRFRLDTAEDTIEAVKSARIRCLTAGQEMIRAYYDLHSSGSDEPTALELIEATRKRYTPPSSQEERYQFFRKYLTISIHRGIFQAVD